MKKLWNKIKASKVGKFAISVAGNALQTVPVVGTLVTNFKENTKESPTGTLKLKGWEYFRIALGLVIGYVIYKGILTLDQVEAIKEVIEVVK